ncbi:MAG: 8-amino-7-oxononanoate synthase [Alphaproteobacteria bacterium]|nr:8-amino-7-oxononanoate synthase [Alphaproteobacteria bacterium]
MTALDQFAAQKLRDIEARQLRRSLIDTARTDGIHVLRNGRRLVSFSCNDYLNLSHHPQVKAAASAALERYGTGAGASRLVTGNHPLFAALESRLAQLKDAEAACIFGSGYLANAGIVPALIGRDDLVLIDELAHACLWAGARLARANVLAYRHNDVEQAAALLAEFRPQHANVLIATDGVFSMDGDLAPLPDLAVVAARHDAWLMVDDAHGLGVVGNGRGARFAHAALPDIPLQMGTLSKAVGGYGGYLCASRPVIDLITNRARSFVYSTGLPPATVAAASAALDIIARDPDLTAKPLCNARRFTRAAGLPDAQSAIVPVVLGTAERALAASRRLEEEGFLAVAIRPPTVPDGTARLRFAFTAGHADTDIDQVAALMRERVLA